MKKTLDVSCFKIGNLKNSYYQQFTNSEDGCLEIINWVKSHFNDTQEWLICGEYTGIYSMTAALVFNDHELSFWLENPNQIRLSSGVSRQKSDKVDSMQIALYASRFMDRVRLYRPTSTVLLKIRELVRFKDRLTKVKTQLSVAANELKTVRKAWEETVYIDNSSKEITSQIEIKITNTEQKILILLETDPDLKRKYELINSVVGVGMQTAIYLLVHTWGFNAFESPRQLACYCGIVPFSKRSGTSLKGRPHISHLANKKLKSLLHMCALNAVRFDPQLKQYYQRKVEEGKHKMNVINNVRNKLIHRIYAVITTGQEYDKNYYLRNISVAV